MNTAVIGDLHFGINPENIERVDILAKSQDLFFNDFLIQTLRENNVTDIIFVGDIFDTKRKIDSLVLQKVLNLFKNDLSDFNCHAIIGNHDCYFKDSLEVTSLTALEPYCKIYKSIKNVTINNNTFLMVPWVTSNVKEKFKEGIVKQGKKFDYVVGHFDMMGVKMESGAISEHGFETELFAEHTNYTLSGHYHNISINGKNNILYVGTPYQLSFGDINQPRGIWIIEGKNKPKFIENTMSYKFVRINDEDDLKKYSSLDKNLVEFVIKSNYTNEQIFEFRKKVELLNPLYLHRYFEPIKEITEFVSDVEIENSDLFVKISEAANVGKYKDICEVYMQIDPPANNTIVRSLFEEIEVLSEKKC